MITMSKSHVVMNGVVVPSSPLPEGQHVEILLKSNHSEIPTSSATRVTPGELRKMPREQRQAILAEAAVRAEEDYRTNQELTGFDAFSEEELDDNESDS